MQSLPIDELEVGGANAPVNCVRSLDDLPDSFPAGATRLRWEIAPDIPLDVLVINKRHDLSIVSFHGATDRSKTTLPRFERLRTLLDFEYNSIFVSDATLHLDPRIWLTWYTGWGQHNLHEFLAQVLTKLEQTMGASRTILSGSSGGGFASLQISALMPNSACLAFNPQTDLGNYLVEGKYYSQQKDYVRTVWPDIWSTFSKPEDIAGSNWTQKADQRVSALSTYATPRDNRVYLVQNIEEDHYEDHFLPFVRAAWEGGNSENLTLWLNRQGQRHVVPTFDMFCRYLEMTVNHESRLHPMAPRSNELTSR